METTSLMPRGRRLLRWTGILAATLMFFSASFAEATWIPDAQMIAALEANIHTPAGAPEPIHPIGDYARFYIGVTINGRRMVRGELVQAPPECSAPHRDVGVLCEYRAGLYINKPLPSIFDGGCGIVNLLFDPAIGRMVWLRCNGVA